MSKLNKTISRGRRGSCCLQFENRKFSAYKMLNPVVEPPKLRDLGQVLFLSCPYSTTPPIFLYNIWQAECGYWLF